MKTQIMNLIKSILNNWFWLVLILFIVWSQGPTYWKLWQIQGKTASLSGPMTNLNDSQIINSLPENKALVLIFWASWCGPCKIELNRHAQAVQNGELPADQIIALNLGEDINTLQQFIKEHPYPFKILIDSQQVLAQKFDVQVTPTLIHIDQNNKIVWASAGISPTSIWRAKRLLAAITN